jgi:hypothetical protein
LSGGSTVRLASARRVRHWPTIREVGGGTAPAARTATELQSACCRAYRKAPRLPGALSF